jgi:hypothetical protein
MGGRDHSEECPFCHVWHGGLDDTPCQCVTSEVVVRRAGELDPDFNLFTAEALAEHDGEVVPLTLEIGGPVVGQATLKYVSDDQALKARLQVADPKVAELLKGCPPNIFG